MINVEQLLINGMAGAVSLLVLMTILPSWVGAIAVILNLAGVAISLRGK